MRFPAGLSTLALEPTAVVMYPSDMAQTGIAVEHQQQDKWCWAAVASSVGNFYARQIIWTQPKVASAVLKQSCVAAPSACNQDAELDGALAAVQQFVPPVIANWLSPSQLFAAMQARHPVCIRIKWTYGNSGAHFAVIGGSTNGADIQTTRLRLCDPYYGDSCIAASEMNGRYQQGGVWTDTYMTA